MIPQDIGVLHFKRGLQSLQLKFYDEAITSFEKAAQYGDESLRICHSRATVLESLRSVSLACREEKDVQMLSESDLFKSLSRLPEPVQVALLFHSPSPFLSHKTQLDLAGPLLLHRRLQRNFIDFLPNEILSDVGRLLVEDQGTSDVAFPLAAVSSRWRNLFRNDPVLWERILIPGLYPRTDRTAKFQALTGAPNSRIRDLTLADGSAEAMKVVSEVVRRGEQLRSLNVCGKGGMDGAAIWQLLGGPSDPSPFLRSLSITHTPKSLINALPPFPFLSTLHTLSLRHQHVLTSIYPLLQLLPNLQTLSLEGNFHLLLPHMDQDQTTLSLPNLTSLTISAVGHTNDIDERIQYNFPKLSKLVLKNSEETLYPTFLFPSASLPNTLNLTHLTLRSCRYPAEETFIEHLRQLPNLLVLVLGRPKGERTSALLLHATMLALTRPEAKDVAGGEAVGEGGQLVRGEACPLLEELDVHEFGSAPLIRQLVKSRLSGGRRLKKISVKGLEWWDEKDSKWLNDNIEVV
ncbi:hypothetical protein BDY24DRAFT_391241 [Mrakia frigida]|uniref:uncharacterized protein n=1 Tax=Mrakia frigida TaxID=29902 RepID=UPI003FCC0BAE